VSIAVPLSPKRISATSTPPQTTADPPISAVSDAIIAGLVREKHPIATTVTRINRIYLVNTI
jgi:hypothetical protein